MPPAKSSKRLPSISSTMAPSACAAKMGVAGETPRAMAALRRRARSRERGPGIGVRNSIAGISSVPPYGLFVQVDVNLLGLEIFLDSPRAELATEAGLLVAAPRCFDVSRLHVIDPDDAGTQRLYDAESLVDVASPHCRREAIGRVVGDAYRVGFTVERNHRCDRTENLFTRDSRAVFYVVENGRLQVIAFVELLWPAASNRDLGFLLANLEIGADTVVLFLADERTHFGFAVERRAKPDALGLFRHGFNEFGINLFLN